MMQNLRQLWGFVKTTDLTFCIPAYRQWEQQRGDAKIKSALWVMKFLAKWNAKTPITLFSI